MKKVSVLVPVYGVEKYIEECARSLFEQTYEDIEYVFVDDCSKDGSIAILERVAEEYPQRKSQTRIIRHDHNKGLGGARLTALQKATGEYVTHVDSDDILPLDAIALLMAKAEESGADIVTGGYSEWRDGKATRYAEPPQMGKEKYLKALLCQNIVKNRIWGRLYRRKTLTENGIYSVEGIDFSEDYAVVPRAVYHSRIATVDRNVYYYRMDNNTSYTHTISEKHLRSHLRACQLVADFFMTVADGSKYRKAVDIGIANAFRCLAGSNLDTSIADETLTYEPGDRICRLCISMLKKRRWVKTADFIYLAYRRLYFSMA